jgi:signal transduction histidine kinase/CHASE3 domain sensor protein
MSDRRKRVRWARRIAVFAPAVIVVIFGALSFGVLRRSLETRDLVAHTRQVLSTSTELLTALLDAETAERGYLLTRDTTFLDPFEGASPRVDSLLAQLGVLIRDSPRQRARIDTLDQRAHERLAALRSAILDARSGQTDVAIGVVAHGPGKRLMDSVRRLIAAVDAEEEELLRQRQSAENRSRELLYATLILGTLIASLMALLVNRNFDRALNDRRDALRESQMANERLQEQAVELEHQAEAAQLAAADAEYASESAQRALHAAEESERRAVRLQAATEALCGALSRGEVANLIVEQAVAALGARSGVLAALEGERIRLVAVRNVSVAKAGDTLSINDDSPLCVAIRTGQPVVLTSSQKIKEQFPNVWPAHSADHVQAVAAFPMENNGRVLGGLLIRFDHPRPFSGLDRSLMSAMSRIAAEAFERARLFDAEREARAEAEAANRAKAAFLASMSHELRTPLQAALGFAQLIRSGLYGPVTDEQSEVLGRVERSQTHLARLIDDILDFARLEAGRVRIKLDAVPVSDVFAELTPIVEPQAASKRIVLAMEAPSDGMKVTADKHRLQQILINLVGNAIKFTPEGGTVRVDVSGDDGHAVIRVRDTGVGIPADRLDSVFEPFVQVDAELTRTASGAGLGLAISRDLARMMGGDLTVTSTVGKGSTFAVSLPTAPASENEDGASGQR